ncbi:hypothetical protein [Clostridium kluyveri]|uniref:Phage protein n=2 Tax=Clostridium kluyveri TaxID=1534 RepID=A5N985_CLOK5|nr:hypothetical protein [Clostridium kluyveri]EDK33866.1 Hypothetical protein CKL_1824 [Clostridium kluyveri DSM 555]BAH06747.1 hypothetical protein CKR_1696 [Clostridium kluyveri NBRC 12016]
MAKYIKKPVVIEAKKYNGHNINSIDEFIGNGRGYQYKKGVLYINTLEGRMKASIGDYIIKGINGEFYPCKPNIFEKTYEKVDE